jgi:probable H4MPT-linked C1 transfer pathway protein
MPWLAIDVGGANLKAADGRGFAAVRPFALWQAPNRLAVELGELLLESPRCERLAITMTAELADCYETKELGVRAILDAAEAAAAGRDIVVYLTDGRLVRTAEAREHAKLAAASNWHALANYVKRLARTWPALLVDLGSTTCDIIPLDSSGPTAIGVTDTERLISGELVYTGVERTPVSAAVQTLPWRGQICPVAAELFATTADAYLLLGDLSDDENRNDAADGRARTTVAAHARLARMLCADTDAISLNDARVAAAAVRTAQLEKLASAVKKVADRLGNTPQTVILSGHGEFLLRTLLERFDWRADVLSLSQILGPEVSRVAPAHALAVLAREWSASQDSE